MLWPIKRTPQQPRVTPISAMATPRKISAAQARAATVCVGLVPEWHWSTPTLHLDSSNTAEWFHEGGAYKARKGQARHHRRNPFYDEHLLSAIHVETASL
jgi:hypothetical protein